MHIGLSVPSLLPESASNGIVTYVRVMRRALIAIGHEVTVFDCANVQWPDDRTEAFAPVRPVRNFVRSIQQRLRHDPHDPVDGHHLMVDQARALHRIRPFDVIETEESFGWAGKLNIGVPVVVRLHGPHFLGKDAVETPLAAARSQRRIAAEAAAIAAADALTSPSQRLLDSTLSEFPTRSKIVAAIPNPIEAVAPGWRWEARQSDPNQILCVGRFDLRKGADIVLAAFVAAVAECPALSLVMAGPDPGIANDDGTRTHFDAYCAAHVPAALLGRIRFTGPLPAAAIAELRMQSAFAVVASRFENFPYSVAESMACGSATIVSDSFGNAELIADGVTGLVVPVGDVRTLTDAIVKLVQNPGRCAAMGDAAYLRCKAWLDPIAVATETASLYARAIDAAR